MTAFLIITSLTVSIDSFVCGFSLSLLGGKKIPIIFGIALTVFIMCLFTNYSAYFLSEHLTEKSASLGGIILIGVGISNLINKNENKTSSERSVIRQSLITGFAVGLDGALANLSLSLMGINSFIVPVTIAISHAFTITLGVLLSKTKLAVSLSKTNFLPPLILILLGIYKTVGLFL